MFLNSETAGRMLGRAVEDDGPVKAMARLIDRTPGAEDALLLLTFAVRGAALLRRGRPPVRVRALQVAVVDATGAGDAFAGIFLGSWLNDGDPELALKRAVQGASMSLTQLGAQGRLVRSIMPELPSGPQDRRTAV